MVIHQADFSKGSVSTLILKVSFPMILAELINLLYSMVDRIYIGHIPNVGSLALTGLGLCFPIISLFNAFARLFGFNGGAPLSAIERGKKNIEEANYVMGNSFFMALITGFLLTAVILLFKRPILFAFGASELTYSYASEYLTIYAIGSVPVLITLTLNAFINSQGFATIGMITVLIGAVLNIVLDPILIFAFSLGVKGAAIATVISQSISALFTLFFLRSSQVELKLKGKYLKLGRRCSKILSLGLSGFTMGATNSIVQIVCNKVAFIWGGDLYVGIMTIVNSVREIFSTPINGIGAGASPVMSFNYGARDGERVKKASNFLLLSTLLLSAFVWLIVFFFPKTIASLFTSDEEMLIKSISALRIYFFGFIFMAFQTSGQQTFVSLGKAKQAVFFSLFRKVIIVVPLTLFLPFIFGINGIFIAEPISNVIGGLAAYLTMRHIVMPELKKL